MQITSMIQKYEGLKLSGSMDPRKVIVCDLEALENIYMAPQNQPE